MYEKYMWRHQKVAFSLSITPAFTAKLKLYSLENDSDVCHFLYYLIK